MFLYLVVIVANLWGLFPFQGSETVVASAPVRDMDVTGILQAAMKRLRIDGSSSSGAERPTIGLVEAGPLPDSSYDFLAGETMPERRYQSPPGPIFVEDFQDNYLASGSDEYCRDQTGAEAETSDYRPSPLFIANGGVLAAVDSEDSSVAPRLSLGVTNVGPSGPLTHQLFLDGFREKCLPSGGADDHGARARCAALAGQLFTHEEDKVTFASLTAGEQEDFSQSISFGAFCVFDCFRRESRKKLDALTFSANAALADRDKAVGAKDEAVAACNEAVAACNEAIAARDGAIVARNAAIEEMDRVRQEFEGRDALRRQEIEELSRSLQEAQSALAESHARTAELEREIGAERMQSDEKIKWGAENAVLYMAESFIDRYGAEKMDLIGINARFYEKSKDLTNEGFIAAKNAERDAARKAAQVNVERPDA